MLWTIHKHISGQLCLVDYKVISIYQCSEITTLAEMYDKYKNKHNTTYAQSFDVHL